MRTSLVIPCFNESEGVPQLCRRLEALVPRLQRDGDVEVIFVDDGSTDGTAEVLVREARQLPYRIVPHDRNRGLGAALRTGMAATAGEEIVTLDSDCTYDPDQVPALLERLRAGADLVTASPYHPEGEVVGVAGWRLLLSKGLSRVYWVVLPQRLHTYTSCFRAYRREAAQQLHAPSDGFLAVTQLLAEAILRKQKVVEVPAVLTTRRFGQSKIKVVRVSLSHLRYIGTILARRISPGPAFEAPETLPPSPPNRGSR